MTTMPPMRRTNAGGYHARGRPCSKGWSIAAAVVTKWWSNIKAAISISATRCAGKRRTRCVSAGAPIPWTSRWWAPSLRPWPRLNLTSMSTPAQRRQQQVEVDRAQHYTLQRLEHAAEQARRRYEEVDPAYRLVAAELEQRWEAALQALQEAREQYARLQRRPEHDQESVDIPPDLRAAFRSLGQSLPMLWPQATFSRAHRKALLRCLLDKVVLDRRAPDTIATRIVWRGGAVSELAVTSIVGRLVHLRDIWQLTGLALTLA